MVVNVSSTYLVYDNDNVTSTHAQGYIHPDQKNGVQSAMDADGYEWV